APFLQDAQRDALRRALCNSGRTVWWSPHTGWLTEHGPSAQSFEELTGFADATPPTGIPRVVKREGWTSFYGACAKLSPQQLAAIAGQAGVHLYGDAPLQVLANDRFVCVHVSRAGRYRLRLPAASDWTDLFSGRKIENGEFDFAEHDVALFSSA